MNLEAPLSRTLVTLAILCFTTSAQAQLFGPPRYPAPIVYGGPAIFHPTVAPVTAYHPTAVSLYPPAYPPVIRPVQVVQHAPPVISFPVTQPTIVNDNSPGASDNSVYFGPMSTVYAPATYTSEPPSGQSHMRAYFFDMNSPQTSAATRTLTLGPPTIIYEGPPVYDGPASVYDAAAQQVKKPNDSPDSMSGDDSNDRNLSPLLVNPDTNKTIRSFKN